MFPNKRKERTPEALAAATTNRMPETLERMAPETPEALAAATEI